ncbi:FUSC family protein [Paludibacterium purpuratum]|uniref:Fusaric acid resistance family protein n=1 Tax=Paludibacterium purpuratum TaxID=1144873 RepID=A0A4R7B644_9NEIS|nr:FUSC family protein [Paludibacterium purpuratum]TDR78373.1 fusaric acid resistance family protein [Paludibacterium purpuratum]
MNIDDIVDLRQLGRCLVVLMPVLLVWWASADLLWLRAAIVAVALYIGVERAHLAPLGVLLQTLAIMAAFLLLLRSLVVPPLFVAGCALMAAGAIGLSAYGRKLRSLGNFVFIPALYLACEAADGSAPAQYAAQGAHLLPYIALCMLPVWLLSLVEHHRRLDAMPWWRHHTRLRYLDDAGTTMAVREAMLAGGLAVACAAALVAWRHFGHGQWVIWSAASVVTGDVLSAKRKLRDRAWGAAVGVPMGIGIGSLLPHHPAVSALIALGAVTSLVSFRRYPIGFAVRCACAAVALTVLNAPADVAAERLIDVVLGGVIGLAGVLAVNRALLGECTLLHP